MRPSPCPFIPSPVPPPGTLALLALLATLPLPPFTPALHAAPPAPGYYRSPTLHGDTLVFVSEGDLWRVPVDGGRAQRLTSHPGTETDPVLSPDGRTVAFSAEYEGVRDTYRMPIDGGLPTRLTFDGTGTAPASWTPDGRLLVRIRSKATLPSVQLAAIDPVTFETTLLPLAEASDGILAPGTGTLYFTRLPKQGSSTKRYRGGWIENLWRFAPGDTEASPLTTDFPGTSRNPMWWQGRLYFLSDRDGIMNLWSMRPDASDRRQHTRHRDFDALGAQLHDGRIVYQHSADLRLFDLARDSDALIPITLASDFDQERERWIRKPLDYLTSAHLSPNGDRVALTARGQIFVAPVGPGRLVEISRPPDVRYRNAQFLPDGETLLALSDATGELEFWRLPANGIGEPAQVTRDGTVFRFQAKPSPDGRWMVWSDKDYKLWIHDLRFGRTRLITQGRMAPPSDFAWSPDSQWLAFADTAPNTYSQIRLFHTTNELHVTVTSDRTDSSHPAWSPDGHWLYFLSDRTLRSLVPSPWGPRQPDPFFTESTRIYQIALTRNLRSPFQPADELSPSDAPQPASTPRKPSPADSPTDASKPNPTPPPATSSEPAVRIDLDGLASRLHVVPLPAGNYSDLVVSAKHLWFTSRDTGFDAKLQLRQLEITAKDPKPKTVVEDLRSFELSFDRKKLLVRKGDAFHVLPVDTSAPAKLDERVPLDAWTFSIQPGEEWRQIFTESWRMLRDYFYDRNLHRVDWPAVLAKYRPLVDRVSDRSELNDLIAAMAGELSTLHIFVRQGDERRPPDDIPVGSLGADLTRDPDAGGWRIRHIYRADPDYPDQRSPLDRPDLEIARGDVILSINGRPTLGVPDPSLLLRHQVGRQVLLEITHPQRPAPRSLLVTPISADRAAHLRYDEWELTRRERVEELGRGRIGYVHLRAMGSANISEWARDFYPVFQRQGLIIDVRHNNGGNIDSWILGKLLRKAWFYWQPRVGDPIWNMHYAFRGHLVVLCNQRTASDGEAFTEGFRRLGLGKVIGTRTWGGEIWLSASRWLVDSGMATAAEIGVYGPEGQWLIEGHGVDPDLVVDNLPHATFLGADAQLDAAIQHLQELIRNDPRPVPSAPPYPDKSFP